MLYFEMTFSLSSTWPLLNLSVAGDDKEKKNWCTSLLLRNNRNQLKEASLLGFLINVWNSPVYWVLHQGHFRGGGGGGLANARSATCFIRASIWPFRLSIVSFMLLMVSCRVRFWSIIACLCDRSSPILSVIMSCICLLWASRSALYCSSKRLLSSSRFSCSTFSWKVKYLLYSLLMSTFLWKQIYQIALSIFENIKNNDTNLSFSSFSLFF